MGIVAIGPFNLWDNGYLCKKTITGIWGIQIDIQGYLKLFYAFNYRDICVKTSGDTRYLYPL